MTIDPQREGGGPDALLRTILPHGPPQDTPPLAPWRPGPREALRDGPQWRAYVDIAQR